MRKNIKILVLAIILVLASAIAVNAADATVTVEASKTQVKPGEEFTVKVSAECISKLAGIDTNLSFDENVLEFIEVVKANKDWTILDEDISEVPDSKYDMNIAGIHNETKEKDDIYIITFKVKEEASINTTTKILLEGITIYDVEQKSYDLGAKELDISIGEEQTPPPAEEPDDEPKEKILTSIKIAKKSDKEEYKVGDTFDKTGLVVIAYYSDGTTKEISDYTISDGNELKEGQTSITISYTEGGVTKTVTQDIKVVVENNNPDEEVNNENAGENNQEENKQESENNNNQEKEENKKPSNKEENKENTKEDDDTKSENKMPYTGNTTVVGMMIIVTIFGIVCLVKYNKYKGI